MCSKFQLSGGWQRFRRATLLVGIWLCGYTSLQAQPSNPVVHFEWGATPAITQVGQNFFTSLEAHNASGELVTNFNGTAAVTERLLGRSASVLITEVETVNAKRVELSNVSTNPVDVSGWRLVLYDRTSWPTPKLTFTLPKGTICPGQGVFTVSSGLGVSVYPQFYAGFGLTWTTTGNNNQIAVLLLNAAGAPEDFFCAADAYPPQIAVPLAAWSNSWSGLPVTFLANANLSYQRKGYRDYNTAADWLQVSNSFAAWNTGLGHPFQTPSVALATVPSAVTFTNGLWNGDLQVNRAGNPVWLRADDANGNVGDSGVMEVRDDPPLALQIPPQSFKATPGYVGQGQVLLAEPLATNLVVVLTSSATNHILVPREVTIAAGLTNSSFAVTNLDNGLVEGPQAVKVLATALGFATATAAITNYDRPPIILTVSLPASVFESAGWSAAGQVRASSAVAVDVPVQLRCTNNSKILVPDFAIIPAGQTNVSFGFAVADNLAVDGNSTAIIQASVPGWVSGQAQVTISDNENTNLNFTLPFTVAEGAGVLTNAGTVQMSGILPTNVIVALTSDLPARVQVPASVVIPAGQMMVQFNLIVSDDAVAEPNQVARVTASAFGFSQPARNVTVLDNEVTRFSFGSMPAAQVLGQPFLVTLSALNTSGNAVTGYAGSVNVAAHGFLGNAVVSPTTLGPFTNGLWSGLVALPTANRQLVLNVNDGFGHTGASPAFDVVPARTLSLPVTDLAYDALRDKLLLGVASNATANSRCILAVDPSNGTLGTSIPLGADPSRLAIADDFSYLYASLEVNSTGGVVRVNLNTQAEDLRFRVGTVNIYGQVVNFVEDMRVQPGHPQTLLATTMIDGGYNQYIAVYDNGVQRPDVVTPVYYVRTYHLAFGESPFSFYVTKPNGLWLNRIDAGGATFLAEIAGGQYGADVVYAGGRLYSTSGQVFNTNNFQTVGTYAASGLVIPEPTNGRVYFLTQNGGQTVFQAFELNTFRAIAQLALPSVSGQAASFVACGVDRFAFRTSANQLHVFDTSFICSNATANLALQLAAAPPQPVLGSNLVYTLTVSNAGPATSFGVVLSNQIPAWSSFVSAQSTQGSSGFANGVATASIGEMTNGAVAVVTVTVQPDAAGAHVNLASVNALSFDPDQTDNAITDVRNVVATTTNSAVTPVNLPSNDIVYDPATERIWASVSAAPSGLSNCLVSLNPLTGEIGIPAVAGPSPMQLAVSRTGGDLYVGIDGNSTVRRFNTFAQTFVSSFFLGTNYVAFDLDVMPGAPQTVAVSRFVPLVATFVDAALYDDGTPRAATVHSPHVRFSPDGAVLYGSGWNGPNWINTSSDGFYYSRVLPGGLTMTNGVTMPFAANWDMEIAGNMVFYPDGRVLDIVSQTTAQRIGVGYAPIVCADEASNRVFYVFNNGQDWLLQQFNVNSYALEASLVLPPLWADPADLIRWGSNGLAYRNGSNQLFLIQIPLMPQVPQLSVSQSVSPPVGIVGSNVFYTITVTNRSAVAAQNVVVTDALPVGAQFVSAQTGQGSVTQSVNSVTFNLGNLAGGTSAQMAIVCTPTMGGYLSNYAAVTADLLDTSSGQNRASVASWVNFNTELQLTNTVNLPGCIEMTYNPSNQTILLSVGPGGGPYSNSIVALDAKNASVAQQIPLADQPGRLALSDDGQYLYTAQGTTGGVARIHLPSGSNDLSFGLGINDGLKVWGAGDLKVVPGQPRSVAVSVLFGQGNEGVSIYDDAVRRTNSSPGREFGGVYYIDFGDDASTLYSALAFYFRKIQVNAGGATLVEETAGLVPGYDAEFEYDSGRIYFAAGRAIDPVAKTIVATYPASGRMAADAANGRVYFVTGTGAAPFNWQLTLRSFNLSNSNEVWSVRFPIASGGAVRVSTLGTNGLAVLTDAGRLFLVPHSQLSTPEADLSLEQSTVATSVNVGAAVATTYTVRNNGPWTATGVILTNPLPAGMNFTSAVSSQGTCVFTNGSVVCFFNPLANGSAATATVTFSAATPGAVTNLASLHGNELDLSPSNNLVAASLTIAPQPTISIRDATVVQFPQAKASITFTLTLSAASSSPVSVTYQTADGTAQAGREYDAASGVVTFNPGNTSRTINLNIIRTTPGVALSSFFRLNLQAPTNAALGRSQAIGTIITRVFRWLTVSGTNLMEGNVGITNASFKISMNQTSATPVSVRYETFDGSALSGRDYQRRAGTLVFAPDTTNLTVEVPVTGDTSWQPDKTFSLVLAQPQDAVLGVGEAWATIVNDDPLPALLVTLPPTNRLVIQGSSASFAVEAVGTPLPLSYQWTFNDAVLLGATNKFLNLTNAQPVDAGVYSVSVQNGLGVTTNVSATLRVMTSLGYSAYGQQLVLAWIGPYLLQSATNVYGPFLDLPAATSPYTNWIGSEPRRFFRLRAMTEGVLTTGGATNGSFTLQATGLGGYNYLLQTSTNLVTWLPLRTNAAPFKHEVMTTDGTPARFFRALILP